MLDELNSLQNLTQFDVVLTGEWALLQSGQYKWSGAATAETPIVGIIFLRCGNRIYWAKSGSSYTEIAPQVYESRGLSNTLSVELFLHRTLNLNVQFMYSLSHSGIPRTTAILSGSLPLIPQSRTIQTGHLFLFASFESTPTATLYAMFLAKQDIKMKRKHIWRLRVPLLAQLTSPLLEILTFGRTGELAI